MVLPKIRQTVVDILKTAFNAKTAIRYESEIWKMCQRISKNSGDSKPEELYRILAYEKVGEFLTAKAQVGSTKTNDILKDIQKNVVGWDSSVYEDFRRKQQNYILQIVEKPKVKEGELPCRNPRCKSKKTVYFEKQTRSADEGFSAFVACSVCGESYKFY